MARTNIGAQSPIGSYPLLPISAAGADLVFTAVDDPVSRSTPLVDNKTVLLAYNTDSVSHTITIGSVADALKRPGDIAAYPVAAGKVSAFGPFRTAGWSNLGLLNIDVSDPKVRLAVITLP